ncbi:TrmB family transcriptional regulator [Halapricum desulfuricans]|uniref:Sugar-specific transcriptional regulator TrmB n=1 Tax=Halapricum desulfuricans TaxID=2841257 RepID=A0A897MYE9_9EURY|nr:TrmB family transcriptional regulator sugar-binding domain-containing protein [Halapricum desulfuricans]QSG05484.1 Sugar-specific transcriptional regulator TrmB [Halapricum desulfuricans]
MNSVALADQLKQFGLSEKEIQTYLAILEQGEAKASTIADDTGVSKRYVYSICEKLEDRGFVDVDDHVVPTKIRAKPPEDVIEMLSGRLEDIEPALKQRFSETSSRPQRFDVIKSRVTVIKRLREYIESAEQELMLAVPEGYLPEVAEELSAAIDRGVLVLLLVSDVDDPEHVLDGIDGPVGSVVRVWELGMPVLLAADEQLGIASPAEMVSRANSDDRAIAIVQGQIVPIIAGSFFANYWPFAQQHFVVDPVELPTTYRSFRHATLQATLHNRAEATVYARATDKPVETDDSFTTIQGTVVETRQGMVEPQTNTIPIEHTIVIETDEGNVSVGGPDSFLEDYEARKVTLERP